MRTLVTVLLFLTSFSSSSIPVTNSNTSSVYICTGEKAYSYHKNRTCSGLNRCQAEIRMVTLEYAKSIKRQPCKICYKKRWRRL